VVSTINTNRSPLLSAVVPVVIYGLRLTLDLPWQSATANKKKFVGVCQEYGLSKVTGDRYAGETFRADFQEYDISYEVSEFSKSELYDAFKPKLNPGEVELLDDGKLQEQLLTLVIKGSKIDHLSGDHDDFANAAVGALLLVAGKKSGFDLDLYVRAFADEGNVVPSRLSRMCGLN
jgi:hypothetical protein